MKVMIVIICFCSMEGVAWFSHKYVMHGLLWRLHRDHHDHSHAGNMEKNDFFFLIFAVPSFFLMYLGWKDGFSNLFYVGLGISLYGIAYFFVHDIFVHQRVPLFKKTLNPYLLALRRAHKQHHKHIDKQNGECFGFLWVPLKYFKLFVKK